MIKINYRGNDFHISYAVEAQLKAEPNSIWFPIALGMYSDMSFLCDALNAKNDEYSYRYVKAG